MTVSAQNEHAGKSSRGPLDPDLKRLLDAAPMGSDVATEGVGPARERLRQMAVALFPDQHPEVRQQDHSIAAPQGHTIAIRTYHPPAQSDSADLPVIVFLHGGGFALGDLESYDAFCKHIAIGADAVVASVDYRLAPEHPYPAAVDDAWTALQWVADHPDEIGGDTSRLAVAGDSAGGNLAAVLAHLCLEAGTPNLRYQLLWYPSLSMDLTLPSVHENADTPLPGIANLRTFISWYAGDTDLTQAPPTLVPARATNFAGLAPAYFGIAEYDPLRDDGLQYAELLSAADVQVEIDVAPGLIHGYGYIMAVVPAASRAVDKAVQAVRGALHGSPE